MYLTIRNVSTVVQALLWATPLLGAGPVDFGLKEFQRAVAERGLNQVAARTKLVSGEPECFTISHGLITASDERGLMYGLLEAADQIRGTGRISDMAGCPSVAMRGIRYFLHNHDLEQNWYYSKEYWQQYFSLLARNRFNRFNLVFAHSTNYQAPPYPFWLSLKLFPQIHVPGLTEDDRERNLEMLRYISQTAADYGVDFTLGIWQHNERRSAVKGLTRENMGPYTYAALRAVLASCPAIRSVQLRTNYESGIPPAQQVEFYRDYVFRAIQEAGRSVILDLRGWVLANGLIEAATGVGMPLRVSTKYWAEHLGWPYQPAETFPGYSYANFLEKPRPYDFYWELWGLGSHRLLLWGDPEYVRRAVSTFTLSGSIGFEIDPPLAQKGFGNRPGTWDIFADGQRDRAFWKWEFERYWLFYQLWGRLSYNPETPDQVWMSELERRFGAAARDVLEGYGSSSGVISEIGAVRLPDPDMFLWPEINPGGLIDAYKDAPPGDRRYVASISEAVRSRIEGIASAKQTPTDTAKRLTDLAARTEQAVALARRKLPLANKEWRSSEPDFLVLAHLARYHAHKQLAADQLTYFYETGDPDALRTAKREAAAALGVWEQLVQLTDGLYPAEMAFGGGDIGHWKDKLPYVRYDLRLIEEREKIFEQFGRFDFGFDFGRPLVTPKGGYSFRDNPYVWPCNRAEPRFRPVDPATIFSEASGFGWVSEGEREAQGSPLTPYLEILAHAKDPRHLPDNVLFRDWIRGRGPQTFRVQTGEGQFTVLFLHPDGTAVPQRLRAENGHLDMVFPEGEWKISGLVVTGTAARPAPVSQQWPKPLSRPRILHVPPKLAPAERPLTLSLQVLPASVVQSVRLHYRPVNQLAKFKTLETASTGPTFTFTIAAEEISTRWDLMYYFEVLNSERTGWFEPDPRTTTPYYVVRID